jgi:hypothetical protein
MLGIGEVSYFRQNKSVFSANDHSIMDIDQQHVLVVMSTN